MEYRKEWIENRLLDWISLVLWIIKYTVPVLVLGEMDQDS